MASLDDLKKRIASVKSTQKITKAMKMVAAAKLRRAQESAEKGRPYSEKMNNVILNLSNGISDKENAPKLLSGTGQEKTHLCVVMTSDRGLCGGFNSNIIKKAKSYFTKLLKEGKDLSIITYSRMSNFAMDASNKLEEQGISVEVIDLRTLNPLDKKSIIKSVNKTKHALVLSEGHYTTGVASEITSIIFENCFKELKKPVIRYTAEDTPVPVAPNLETSYVPTVEKIVNYTIDILK